MQDPSHQRIFLGRRNLNLLGRRFDSLLFHRLDMFRFGRLDQGAQLEGNKLAGHGVGPSGQLGNLENVFKRSGVVEKRERHFHESKEKPRDKG